MINKAPLSDEEATKALAECKDLMSVGTVLTYEQVQALVDSGGDPDKVDEIFGGTSKPRVNTTKAATPQNKTPEEPKADKTLESAPKSDTGDTVKMRLAAINAKKAAEQAAKEAEAKKAAEAAAPAEDLSNLSDEEFMARFGGV
jgi:hypothetical protein